MKMTFKEYFLKNMQNGIIPNTALFNTIPCLVEYFANQQAFDYTAVNRYKFMLMSDIEPTIVNLTITGIVKQLASYKWDKLYKTLNIEYNPIWNVDGTETTVHGERVSTLENGEKISTTENGEKSTTNIIGSRSATNTQNVVPFDTNAEFETGKNASITSEATDTSTDSAHTNTTTDSAHTNTSTENQYTDTLTRQGNIGVTSAQSLINQEREVAMFNFYEMVLSDVINAITIPYFNIEEGECLHGSIII